MRWKRILVDAFDNRLGRPFLAGLATAIARQITREDVEVCHEQIWLHRVGSYFIPDGPRLRLSRRAMLAWKDQISRYLRHANEFWFVDYQPKPGDVIIDVGAGRGEDVLAFSQRVGRTGRVLAIEADPTSFDLLCRFCALNRLDNVIPIQAAVLDSEGTALIHAGTYWYANTVGREGRGIPVRSTTLDTVCREHEVGRIDFLKINIEGSETLALLGMNEMLKRVGCICVCCHDFRADRGDGEEYRTLDFVLNCLTESGFTIYRRLSDPRDFVRNHVHGTRVTTAS